MTAWLPSARQAWTRLARREQLALMLMGGLALALLLWSLGLAPALRTWREVPAQREALESQWLQMQRVAAEARELKALPPVSAEQSSQALRAATERLGSKGKLSLVGDRATLVLTGATPEQLTDWLAEARSGARARPIELQLSHTGAGLQGQVVVGLSNAGG